MDLQARVMRPGIGDLIDISSIDGPIFNLGFASRRGYHDVLLTREQPNGSKDTDGSEQQRNEARDERQDLKAQANPHDGIRLTCHREGWPQLLPSGVALSGCGIVLLLIGLVILRSARNRYERAITVVALALLIASTISGAFVSYETQCWN